MDYYRVRSPGQANAIPVGPNAMVFRWRNDKLEQPSMTFGGPTMKGYSVAGVLDPLLGIMDQQIEGPAELLRTELPGDWVVRRGVKDTKIIEQLNTIIQKELSLPIRLEFREVDRPVYVASGEYQLTLLPDRKEIEFFGTQLVPDSGAGGGTGTFDEMLSWLGRWVEKPIVSEVKNPPKGRISWRQNARSPFTDQMRKEDHDPILVLGHVTAQTGIAFLKDERKVRILFVEPLEK